MDLPADLSYTEEHEWIATDDDGNAKIGVTAYAIEQLGDIVHLEFPEVGEILDAGASFGTIESTKTVSDLYMPIGGKVIAINEALLGDPESLQDDPYDGGWLIEVEVTEDNNDLMSAEDYKSYLENQED